MLAEYPDFIRPPKRPAPTAIAMPYSCPVTMPQTCSSDDLRRASLYLAQCEPAVQGLCGHNKLLWAAGAMTWGCDFSDEQAYAILANEYNPRCVPSWNLDDPKDEKDFRRKITESRKHHPDKPYRWILDDPSFMPLSAAALANAKKSADALTGVQNAIGRFQPFPVDALPEPFATFVRAACKAIGCDSTFIALPLLVVAAAMIGTTRVLELKRGWCAPAILWTAIVGESGTMKTPALKLVLRPLRANNG